MPNFAAAMKDEFRKRVVGPDDERQSSGALSRLVTHSDNESCCGFLQRPSDVLHRVDRINVVYGWLSVSMSACILPGHKYHTSGMVRRTTESFGQFLETGVEPSYGPVALNHGETSHHSQLEARRGLPFPGCLFGAFLLKSGFLPSLLVFV